MRNLKEMTFGEQKILVESIGENIQRTLPDDCCFILVVVPNENGIQHFYTNIDRTTVSGVLEELADDFDRELILEN